jgi:hypothetical protein
MTSLNKDDMSALPADGSRDTIVIPVEQEWRFRAQEVIKLLDEWAAEDSTYDEETWPALKKALDENRRASGKLFDDQ